MPDSDYKLLALFAVVVACLILRITVESTGYVSPDSKYYLEVAENIITGKGLYHSPFLSPSSQTSPGQNAYLAVWPLGYPVLISIVAWLFFLPVFWASKVVNFIFLGLCCLLFRKINRAQAYLFLLTMCSFTFLEVFSYTWSEGPFLFGIVWLGYLLNQYEENDNSFNIEFKIFLCCSFLFLIRYAGGFSFLFIALLGLGYAFRKSYGKAIRLFYVFGSLCLLAGIYLYFNYVQTGYFTGGERLFPKQESTDTFLKYLLTGLFNEFFILKNYYFRGEPVILFMLTALFQIIILTLIIYQVIKLKFIDRNPLGKLIKIYTYLGLFYLVVLIVLRRFSPFDEFDYRLLSPLTLCLQIALLQLLNQISPGTSRVYITKCIIILFGVSLLFNLPKVYLINYFQNILFAFWSYF